MHGKTLNEYIPVIEVENIVIFPSQSCLVHISRDYSLFKEMVETPKQTYYAICLSKNKNNQYDCIGTMLQISNIEYIPDLRKCVVLAKGLYHIQLDNIVMKDDHFTGDIIPLDYEILDPFYVSLSKPKRWTLPTTIESGEASSCSNTRKRRRPCSMRSSISSPNQSTYRQESVIPGAYSRPTWNDLILKQVYGHSSPLLSVGDVESQKPIPQ
jgi:ATP-dependent Lon protease